MDNSIAPTSLPSWLQVSFFLRAAVSIEQSVFLLGFSCSRLDVWHTCTCQNHKFNLVWVLFCRVAALSRLVEDAAGGQNHSRRRVLIFTWAVRSCNGWVCTVSVNLSCLKASSCRCNSSGWGQEVRDWVAVLMCYWRLVRSCGSRIKKSLPAFAGCRRVVVHFAANHSVARPGALRGVFCLQCLLDV